MVAAYKGGTEPGGFYLMYRHGISVSQNNDYEYVPQSCAIFFIDVLPSQFGQGYTTGAIVLGGTAFHSGSSEFPVVYFFSQYLVSV